MIVESDFNQESDTEVTLEANYGDRGNPGLAKPATFNSDRYIANCAEYN